MPTANATPVLQARGLVKRYGHVTALDGADFELGIEAGGGAGFERDARAHGDLKPGLSTVTP